MSCEQTTKAYEACHERFWELMEDYEFQFCLYENFLSPQQQWKEKHMGFNEDPYDNAFEYLWNWDCELMSSNIEECISKYLISEIKRKRGLTT